MARVNIPTRHPIQPINNQNTWVILDTINLKFYSFDFTSNTWNALPQGTNIDTTSLSNRINLKLNLSDTASMLTNYLRTGTAASTYLTQANAASTYLPLTGGTLTGLLRNTSQRLTGNITISDFDNTFNTVQISPSSSATVNLAIQQNLSGAANISMGGNQGGGGNFLIQIYILQIIEKHTQVLEGYTQVLVQMTKADI